MVLGERELETIRQGSQTSRQNEEKTEMFGDGVRSTECVES